MTMTGLTYHENQELHSYVLENCLHSTAERFILFILVNHLVFVNHLACFFRSCSSATIVGMGKAGKVLKQILEMYSISQYSLAAALKIERTNVYRWVHEQRDPAADTVVNIVEALSRLNPKAAQEFVKLYIGNIAQGDQDED